MEGHQLHRISPPSTEPHHRLLPPLSCLLHKLVKGPVKGSASESLKERKERGGHVLWLRSMDKRVQQERAGKETTAHTP